MMDSLTVPPDMVTSLTKAEERLIESLHQSFGRLTPPLDLDLYLHTAEGGPLLVLERGHATLTPAGLSAGAEARVLPVKLASGLQLTACLIDKTRENSEFGGVVQLLLAEMGQRLDAEEREELLLEEVGTNWESLDALYEVSTEAFRSGNTREAIRRLVLRLAAFKPRTNAAVYLIREGQLEPYASSSEALPALPLGEGGILIRQVFEEKRALVVNQCAPSDILQGMNSLGNLTSLAAVPITLRSEVVGCVLVWMEGSKIGFDTSFSRLIETVSQNASMLMECESHDRTVRDNERLAQDIEIASLIQQTMLGGDVPRDLPGVEVAAFSIPSQRIDGDFFDFYHLKDGSVHILIGDVMGKGVTAALLGVAIKRAFNRSIALGASASSDDSVQPLPIVRRAAQKVTKQLIELEHFVTLCFMRLNAPTGELQFVDCGHTRAIVHRKATGESFFIAGNDMPFGVQQEQTFTQQACQLVPGDTVFFYSDGVTENQNAEGELFGEQLLIETIERWSSLGPEILIGQIRKQASEFRGRSDFADDFTCIGLRIGLKQEMPLQVLHAEFPCRFDQLKTTRDWLHEVGSAVPQGGLNPEDLARLELACGEAMNNCIIHGSKHPCSALVYFQADIYQDSLTLHIRHKGQEFDPFNVPPPSFDGSLDGGFGLYIVARSSDQLAYRRGEDGMNQVSISILKKQQRN